MQVMAQTGDPEHDRFQRVSHGGTFNANPYCAATGNAALRIVATGEMQAPGRPHGRAPAPGPARDYQPAGSGGLCLRGGVDLSRLFWGRSIAGLDANTLKNVPAAVQNGFRQAVQVRGVDLMSRCSGVLSGVHTEADIDQSLEAFDGAINAMLTEGLVQHG